MKTTRTRPVRIEGTDQHLDRSFGIYDRKGRRMGAEAHLYEADYVASEDGGGWPIEPGHYFMFRPHATRNGVQYGASQETRYFTTAEERAAAVQEYFAAAHARAIRSLK